MPSVITNFTSQYIAFAGTHGLLAGDTLSVVSDAVDFFGSNVDLLVQGAILSDSDTIVDDTGSTGARNTITITQRGGV